MKKNKNENFSTFVSAFLVSFIVCSILAVGMGILFFQVEALKEKRGETLYFFIQVAIPGFLGGMLSPWILNRIERVIRQRHK